MSAVRAVAAKPGWSEPALWFATWFGAGLLPKMPGTWGALAALPVAWIAVGVGGPWLLIGLAAVVFLLGMWASERYMRAVQVHDPAQIVVDEVVGQWLTLAFIPLDPVFYMLGFFLFRAADMLKPWPANWIDRRVGGPLGVMADDVVAALYAGVVLWLVVEVVLP